MRPTDEGAQPQPAPDPTYEANQGSPDAPAGGSTDPHNTLSHADSGNETENDLGEDTNDR